MDAASLSNLRHALGQAQAPVGADAEYEGLWREHVPVVDAFMAVCRQWRTVSAGGGGVISPMGGAVAPSRPLFIGLDYAAVRAGLEAEAIEVTPELWRGLRVMEDAACAALNEG
ncbi:DUF1799 domain-containing protein [Bradyrhizobium manausense]